MSEILEELKVMDSFKSTTLEKVVDMARDSEVNFSRPAEDFLLKTLKIPASYYRNASEDFKERMYVESLADKKDMKVRLVTEAGGNVIGLGPHLDPKVLMTPFFDSLQGEHLMIRGSLVDSGLLYFFKSLEIFTFEGEEIHCGYNVILSQLFNKGLTIRPALFVIKCTNGLVDNRKVGKEFRISPVSIGVEQLKMVAGTIVGVVADMSSTYQNMVEKAYNAKLEFPRAYVEGLFLEKRISKSLSIGGLKIVDKIDAGFKTDDPGFPASYGSVWDVIQILSFVARSYQSPTSKVSAEISLMDIMYQEVNK